MNRPAPIPWRSDRVLGAQADRLCTCDYLLPSAHPDTLKPEYHWLNCPYRREVLGTRLLPMKEIQIS